MICAGLSLLGRIQAARFGVVIQPWLPALTLGTIMALELIASLAVVLAHATGHHDFCTRIRRRIIWLGRGLQKMIYWIGYIFHSMLQEVPTDLERRSKSSYISSVWPQSEHGTIGSVHENGFQSEETKSTQGISPDNEIEEVRRPCPHEEYENLRQMRRTPSTYGLIHQELRSIGARVRWSAVRYAMFPKLQRTPFQDLSLLIAVQPQVYPPVDDHGHLHQSQPLYQFPGRPRSNTPLSPDSSMTSVVMDIVDQNNTHGISQLQPLEVGEQLRPAISRRRSKSSRPYIQLPGKIYNVRVNALPDTGSSQNVIDFSFVERLFPQVPLHPLSDSDKPLRAPDEELIPCEGKVRLPWVFENETEIYEKWYYVVQNCPHDVIIGNGLLRETETMEKHLDRLEITEPTDPDSLPGNLVSEAQEHDRLRQVVFGKVNGEDMTASLDTGCEANLMSHDCVTQLGLTPTSLPTSKQIVTFANGRTRTTLGLVEVYWSFADTPDITTKVKCYVLPKCIHSIIFGARFVVLEKPWEKHAQALDVLTLEDAGDAGVVDLRKKILDRIVKPKEDPQAAAQQKLKDEKFNRLEAILESPISANMPAPPPRAVLAPAVGSNSTQHGVQSSAVPTLSQTATPQTTTSNPSSSSAQASTGGASNGQNATPGTFVPSPQPHTTP